MVVVMDGIKLKGALIINQNLICKTISALGLAFIIGFGVYFIATTGSRREDALRLAADFGRDDVVESLLQQGADVNCRDDLGKTPLMYAAEGDHTTVAKYLLSKGAQINARDKYGDSALALAVHGGREDMVELLLSRNADISAIDPTGNITMLHWAIMMSGSVRITRLLVLHGADVNARDSSGNMPIDIARSRPIMEILVRHGAKVDNLNTAVRLDDVKLTGRFLKGTPEGLNGALIAATDCDSINAARLLISRGANPAWQDEEGNSPVKCAAKSGSIKVLELLLDRGTKPDIADADGKTPLHYAAEYNKPSAVEVLLRHGANPNAKTKKGYTPIYYAADYSQSKKIANLLLSHGAKADESCRSWALESP